MKLFDIFDKSGSKIGEVHEHTPSSDFGLVAAIIGIIVVICGIKIWPMLFDSMQEAEKISEVVIFFAAVIIIDAVIVLIRIFALRDSFNKFMEDFWGMFIFSAILLFIFFLVYSKIVDDKLHLDEGILLALGSFMIQLLPSLIMTVIVHIAEK